MRCGLQATWNKSCACRLQWYPMLKAPDLSLTVDIFTWLIWVSSTIQLECTEVATKDPNWSKLRDNNRSNYPLIIHSLSTYHPLIHHWFVPEDLCLVALMIERWRCCHTADLCHRGSWFHFCILEMPRHLKDMKRTSSIDCSNWWRIWNFHEFPIAFETLPSLNSVEVCEAGAGGQQERTWTWQEREAHRAIHDQPVTPSFFPMGWTRRTLWRNWNA